ncbi:hypothetical protein N2601_08770 [Rhizobium sp. CB3060]|uniref:hypothetical protein n=1 Tax=Rhizobium sp. CB3060 TaxID=3138255 RepID=UPI0021A90534|nr:hypothetical protein [Rhizobium tropici]UWU23022.1 hypothetical protein N2601_08770 [Rhizobium tropici]
MSLSLFDSRDPAMRAGLELGILTAVGSVALHDGLRRGLANADRVREADVRRRHADKLAEARGRADDLGRIAIVGAQRIAALEAEVRSLRKALDQRQAFIDRVRNS